MERALTELSETRRPAFTLNRLRGLSLDEAAHSSGSIVATIKVAVHRAARRRAGGYLLPDRADRGICGRDLAAHAALALSIPKTSRRVTLAPLLPAAVWLNAQAAGGVAALAGRPDVPLASELKCVARPC